MSDTPGKPLRALLCGAVTQNFFDLPADAIGPVWQATGEMLKGVRDLPGVKILGTLDDDELMVGTSPNGWPWTFYIMADMPDHATVVAACNLFRTTAVGEHLLWKYMRVEARIGRDLTIPA
ncbi:hypothetical protein [Sphingomonas sp.]|uniref:hypothetical protein n=1 Tax=Sphingomonas sp. TaxID=28214 RepID=UPI000DB21283|nr:hypothetical protein [Sphingomonas sp.]PZU10771.1 MAG: hypothetical protein DI605_03770 [Sphingomonas sp.]